MSAKSIVIVLIVLMAPFILAIGALMQNRLPWSDPPGFSKRLRTYLAANIAETVDDTKFPELSMRAYPLDQDRLIPVVEQAMLSLGWDILMSNRTEHTVHAIVTTALWRFKDDVLVSFISVDENDETGIHVRASSRTGRGDFGTNTRHILNLYRAIENEIERLKQN